MMSPMRLLPEDILGKDKEAQSNTKSNMSESNLQNDFFSSLVIIYVSVLQNMFCKAW